MRLLLGGVGLKNLAPFFFLLYSLWGVVVMFVMVARDDAGYYIEVDMEESSARYIVETYWGASLNDPVDMWKLSTAEVWRRQAWEQEKLRMRKPICA